MGSIGARIRAEREAQKISRPELARFAGIAPTTLSDLELGESKSTTALHKIAARLGLRPEWLETGKGQKLAPSMNPLENAAGSSQPARLDPQTIVDVTRVALVVLRRRDPKATLDLTQLVDATLFAEVYAEANALPDTPDREFHLGALVADLMQAREARNVEREAKQVVGSSRSKTRRESSGQ